jgi:hypothetical protein
MLLMILSDTTINFNSIVFRFAGSSFKIYTEDPRIFISDWNGFQLSVMCKILGHCGVLEEVR